jgi:sulfide dehydrogenase cytochrome subunit
MKYTRSFLLLLIIVLSASVFAAELETLVEDCDGCHGPQGVSGDSDMPTIAGQLATYLNASMKSYQNWGRPCIKSAYRHGDTTRPVTTMCKISESLSTDEIEALGKYYEAQEFIAAQQDFDTAQAADGANLHEQYCETCHKQGGSVAARGPRLAGQWAPYLRVAIGQALAGEHLVPRVMENRLLDFSADDIDALMNFYASQQAPDPAAGKSDPEPETKAEDR